MCVCHYLDPGELLKIKWFKANWSNNLFESMNWLKKSSLANQQFKSSNISVATTYMSDFFLVLFF